MSGRGVTVVDAGKVREFTGRCQQYQKSLVELEQRLNTAVRNAMQSWRDPDMVKLLKEIDGVRAHIGQARQVVDGCLMPFLAQKTKAIGEKGQMR